MCWVEGVQACLLVRQAQSRDSIWFIADPDLGILGNFLPVMFPTQVRGPFLSSL